MSLEIKNIKDEIKAEDEIDKAIDKVKGKKKKKSWFSKLFRKKREEVEMDDEIKPEQENIETVYHLLRSGRNHLIDMKLEEAKKDYGAVMRIYDKLSAEDKKRVRDDIEDLYEDRKNAEALKLHE